MWFIWKTLDENSRKVSLWTILYSSRDDNSWISEVLHFICKVGKRAIFLERLKIQFQKNAIFLERLKIQTSPIK